MYVSTDICDKRIQIKLDLSASVLAGHLDLHSNWKHEPEVIQILSV